LPAAQSLALVHGGDRHVARVEKNPQQLEGHEPDETEYGRWNAGEEGIGQEERQDEGNDDRPDRPSHRARVVQVAPCPAGQALDGALELNGPAGAGGHWTLAVRAQHGASPGGFGLSVLVRVAALQADTNLATSLDELRSPVAV